MSDCEQSKEGKREEESKVNKFGRVIKDQKKRILKKNLFNII
jgi:hypothetical protein